MPILDNNLTGKLMQHNKLLNDLLMATALTLALPGIGSSYEVNNLVQVVGSSGGRGFLYSNGVA
jgi:hypothetical protein